MSSRRATLRKEYFKTKHGHWKDREGNPAPEYTEWLEDKIISEQAAEINKQFDNKKFEKFVSNNVYDLNQTDTKKVNSIKWFLENVDLELECPNCGSKRCRQNKETKEIECQPCGTVK